jgi:DNA-binding XRE family transcriptional regulator
VGPEALSRACPRSRAGERGEEISLDNGKQFVYLIGMNLGAKLRRLRLERGMTQKVLAEKVGITSVYLAYLEGGPKSRSSRTPSLRLLQRLAKALRVKVGDLFQ